MNAFPAGSNASCSDTTPTAPEMGWASKRNGELLTLATAKSFDVFLTADRNLSYQQDLSGYDIAVVVLVAPSNRLNDLRPLMPQLLATLERVERRRVTLVSRQEDSPNTPHGTD